MLKSVFRIRTSGRRFFSVSESNLPPGFAWVRNPENKSYDRDITSDYLVKTLSSRVYEAAIETKTSYAATLSAHLNNDVYLKREDTQPVFSFKIRGAYNKIASLSPAQLKTGVVTCSAGNHAQGVAFSAAKMGTNATIVMPEATPEIKVNAVRRLGGKHARILLHGSNFDAAAAEARRLCTEDGLAMVHPFDDEHVIAGQGTIGMEILKVRSTGRKGGREEGREGGLSIACFGFIELY
jgi:threonine dehydratase